MTAVGFEPTPLRTAALTQRLTSTSVNFVPARLREFNAAKFSPPPDQKLDLLPPGFDPTIICLRSRNATHCAIVAQSRQNAGRRHVSCLSLFPTPATPPPNLFIYAVGFGPRCFGVFPPVSSAPDLTPSDLRDLRATWDLPSSAAPVAGQSEKPV